MKNLIASIVLLLLLAAAPPVLGQGYVVFNNRINLPGGVIAPIYGVNPNCLFMRLSGNATTNGGAVDYTGCLPLQGTGFTAALWGNNPSGGWSELAQTRFRTTSVSGFIQPSAADVVVPWVTVNGTPVEFQVRVWGNAAGTVNSWAAALANSTVPIGISDTFTTAVTTPPSQNPSYLIGLTSFNLTLAAGPCVPEPSVVILVALAGVALLWRRKKVSR